MSPFLKHPKPERSFMSVSSVNFRSTTTPFQSVEGKNRFVHIDASYLQKKDVKAGSSMFGASAFDGIESLFKMALVSFPALIAAIGCILAGVTQTTSLLVIGGTIGAFTILANIDEIKAKFRAICPSSDHRNSVLA
jgi:hypothetical protein